MTEYKAGGLISCSLTDGTRISSSPITSREGSLFICAGRVRLVDTGVRQGNFNINILAETVNYTPPGPSWDDGITVLVQDRSHNLWASNPSGWTGLHSGITLTAAQVEERCGPCKVAGVKP